MSAHGDRCCFFGCTTPLMGDGSICWCEHHYETLSRDEKLSHIARERFDEAHPEQVALLRRAAIAECVAALETEHAQRSKRNERDTDRAAIAGIAKAIEIVKGRLDHE